GAHQYKRLLALAKQVIGARYRCPAGNAYVVVMGKELSSPIDFQPGRLPACAVARHQRAEIRRHRPLLDIKLPVGERARAAWQRRRILEDDRPVKLDLYPCLPPDIRGALNRAINIRDGVVLSSAQDVARAAVEHVHAQLQDLPLVEYSTILVWQGYEHRLYD